MKKMMTARLFVSILSLPLFFSSCSKKEDKNCPTSFAVTASKLTPTVGETVTLSAAPQKWNYVWTGPLNFHEVQTTGANSINIDNIKINQSGWWTGSLTGTGCGVMVDSVYIDVKYRQGTPSCSLTNNQVRGTGVPDLQATSVRKFYDNSWNTMSIHASGTFGLPTYTFLFNSYNGRTEPKDGLYKTQDIQVFNQFHHADMIYAQCQYGSYFFKTQPGQTIYVSHVNGKLRIALCDLKMNGDNGNSVMVTSTFSGQVTEN